MSYSEMLSLHYVLMTMVFLTSRTISSQECTINPSFLDFGSGANEYAVCCLPDVNFSLPASWAGQIPIPGTKNDELFFWLFEAEEQTRSDDLISENISKKDWQD